MRYKSVKKATFLSRPNRFIAQVMLDGAEATVHVKNTGRCRELLTPGATVYLAAAENPNRKLMCDLIAVDIGWLLSYREAQAPNQLFRAWAETGRFLPDLTQIRPEYRYKESQFDFYLEQEERRHLVEVKGVTLEENGVVRFPDAPTERGVKHLKGLTAALEDGFETWVCFVVQLSPARYLEPNDRTHPAFGEALRQASAAGVHVLAMSCRVVPDSLDIEAPVPVQL